jgi:zinc protease
MRVSTHTTPSGLKAIFVADISFLSLNAFVAVRSGPRYETQQQSGTAHFLEHMLIEGTKKFPTSLLVNRFIESIGGITSAYTNKEYTLHSIKTPLGKMEEIFSFLEETLFNASLDEESLTNQKRIILEELSRSKDNIESDNWDIFLKWIYNAEGIGRSALGNKKDIQKMTRQKLTEYYASYYQARNMVMVIVGNFDPEATKERLEKFSKKQEGSTLIEHPLEVAHERSKSMKINAINNQFIYGRIIPLSFNNRERFILKLIANLLSYGSSSRLYEELVYKKGLAYAIFAGNWEFSDNVLFTISGSVTPKSTDNLLSALTAEVEKICSQKISPQELALVKIKTISDVIFSREKPESIAQYYIDQGLYSSEVITLEEYLKVIKSITTEEIKAFASSYLKQDNMHLYIGKAN